MYVSFIYFGGSWKKDQLDGALFRLLHKWDVCDNAWSVKHFSMVFFRSLCVCRCVNRFFSPSARWASISTRVVINAVFPLFFFASRHREENKNLCLRVANIVGRVQFALPPKCDRYQNQEWETLKIRTHFLLCSELSVVRLYFCCFVYIAVELT